MRNPQRKASSIIPPPSTILEEEEINNQTRKLSLPTLLPELPQRRPSFVAEYLRKPKTEHKEASDEDDSSMEDVPLVHGPHRDSRVVLKKYFGEVEHKIFEIFGNRETHKINVYKFFSGLLETGLRLNDPRLKETIDGLRQVQEKFYSSDEKKFEMDYEPFLAIISHNLEIIVRAFSFLFVIPDFGEFVHSINELYFHCKNNNSGKVASYIPQLSRALPENWGVSICTVDGQRHSIGDVNVPFTLQSCSYAVNYCLLVTQKGEEEVHKYIGMESSGRHFSEICLDYNHKPHNPMINAGAIMTASLIKPELSSADRFDYMFNQFKLMCGNEYLGFNNAVFLSERECADRNFALAYFMRENKCFPPGTKINDVLDFYFQLCSLEITAESGAVIAATLANGGINPLTCEPVLDVEAVRNTLALMHSCGMYNYSGQFAFQVGLPAKSGVSGCILLVVPNTLGICMWSPALDANGNSCRGVQFCQELVSRFKFHHFDNLRGHNSTKVDPRSGKGETKAQSHFDLLFSVAAGDLSSVRRHALSGTDLSGTDYDGRTALHVAASEGHYEIVNFLVNNCKVFPHPKDRWGQTPLDNSEQFGHKDCAKLIENHLLMRNDDNSGIVTNGLIIPVLEEPPITPREVGGSKRSVPFDVVTSVAEVLSFTESGLTKNGLYNGNITFPLVSPKESPPRKSDTSESSSDALK